MPKRAKTDIVQLKLRIREALRKRLEGAAKVSDTSLNSEMAARLENSFLQIKNDQLVDALTGGGDSLVLLRALGFVLQIIGPNWRDDPDKVRLVAEATQKIIGVMSGAIRVAPEAFPERDVQRSADHLVWLLLLTEQFVRSLDTQLLAGNRR